MAGVISGKSVGGAPSGRWRGCAWLLLAIFLLPAARAEMFRAATAQEAAAAVRRAQAGDEIVLGDGEFKNLELTLSGKGSHGKPLRLRVQNEGQAILTGSPKLSITGAFIELQGLVFRDCVLGAGTRGAVVFDGSANSRVSHCRFENSKLPHGVALVSFRNGARDNLLDHNCFLKTQYKAVMVVVDDRSLKTSAPVNNRIEHNRFEDVPRYVANGAETIQIGQRASPHSGLRTETVVADNEFIRCNGEAEIISVKTSGNLIRSNSFRECMGEVVMRHGHDTIVRGNRFEGGLGGIRLSGHGHLVADNFISGCRGTGIRLYYGTPDLTHPASYLPVFDCVISNNTIRGCGKAGIFVGDNKNSHQQDQKWGGPPWFAKTVMDCTIAPHDNRIVSNNITGKAGSLLKLDDAPQNSVESNTLNDQLQEGQAQAAPEGGNRAP